MTTMEVVLLLGLAAVGAVSGWLLMQRGALAAREAGERGQREQWERQAMALREELERTGERVTALTAEAAGLRAKIEQIEKERLAAGARDAQMKEEFRSVFKALAGETLKESTQSLLQVAQQKLTVHGREGEMELEKRKAAVEALVKPIAETLKRTDEKLAAMEKERTAAYSGLVEQVKGMQGEGMRLREETGRLVRALREPQVRGRYGEFQLRKVAELAGMTNYCDFAEQNATRDDAGNILRPDMIVRLPSQRVIVVDAKMNSQAYLEASQAATPEESEACLERFARHVAEQATALSRKKYWTQYEGSPEFVVMFVPHDAFLDAALSRRPEILEDAARNNVILATPSTLIALLRAVAVGYHEQRLAKAAEELREVGKELIERAATAFGHVVRVGESLEGAVKRYNEFVGSYQQRLEPSLKKMEELGIRAPKELPVVEPVTVTVRSVPGPARLPGA